MASDGTDRRGPEWPMFGAGHEAERERALAARKPSASALAAAGKVATGHAEQARAPPKRADGCANACKHGRDMLRVRQRHAQPRRVPYCSRPLYKLAQAYQNANVDWTSQGDRRTVQHQPQGQREDAMTSLVEESSVVPSSAAGG